MYSYEWDSSTGGFLLNSTPLKFSKEPRPVYYKEMDILGFDHFFDYAKNDTYPYMWAEANNYFYRGKLIARTKGGSTYKAPELIILDDLNGESLQFVDIPAMVEKNRSIMESLEQETIKKIYNIYSEYQQKVDLFYVAFSGGKDSVVALDIVQRALPHNSFKVLFGDTGMEFGDTYRVAETISEECAEQGIEFLRSESKLNPLESWRLFGPPAQRNRWCCSVHKTAPQILLLRELTGNPHFRGMAFTGIRGDESVARSEYEEVSLGEKVRGQYSCHPLLDWNSAELFNYIFDRELIINETYKKGNSRAGCLVCPLAATKNMYFKEYSYSKYNGGYTTTTDYNKIILETTSKVFSDEDAITEFMNIAGWKARRSGRELSIAKDKLIDDYQNGVLTLTLLTQATDWRQWIKTIGEVLVLSDDYIKLLYHKNEYEIFVKDNTFTVALPAHTRDDILFASALKSVFRKAAYCVCCQVCEANCPNGYIKMIENQVYIDDKCVKCGKCHDIFYGCLAYNSLRLPKGEKKMGSVDRYANFGIEYDWVKKYFVEKDDFWTSENNQLGKKMVEYLKKFLSDAEVTDKNKITAFGRKIADMGIETTEAWALLLCNLVYTAEFNWWLKNSDLNVTYTPEMIINMLGDDYSNNSKKHIVSAYKNIFASNKILADEIRFGVCDYYVKGKKRYLNSLWRETWEFPDPRVILYSLYKFAEKCNGYYQFTLARLLNHEIESDGISPTEIFGLDRDTMEKLLSGLAVNYPQFINVSFSIDLDNVSLKSDKSALDVLELF